MATKKSKPLQSLDINRRAAINSADTDKMSRHPDVYTKSTCGPVSQVLASAKTWYGSTEAGWVIEVASFRKNVFRLRFSPHAYLDETPTYALPEGTKQKGEINVREDASHYRFSVDGGELVLAKADGSFYSQDTKGRKTLSTKAGPEVVSSIMAGTTEIGVDFQIVKDEAFHGLGDKPGHLDMRGRTYTMWNTDAFGYSEGSDEIYKSIPFVIAERGDRRQGLLFDNTHRASFDFGKSNKDTFSYRAEGGELTVFFFFGEDPIEICADYCKLTGTPPMPPMWALGYQQCRWSYYPEQRVREVVKDFREKQIPCDAIYLDIDYMDNYKCFTVSETLFPDLKKMIKDFRKEGMRTVVMIDPGIAAEEGYDVYESGSDKDVWCRRTNGEVMRGPVWPEECVFPDYTDPEVRDWWGKLYKELYKKVGVSGFWNDMNEPAVFSVNRATFPDEVMHSMDGYRSTHARAHNIYGLKMTEASFDGLRKIQPKVRPFLLTRATYAGGQRYAAVWTGDNTASWRHLQVANHQCIRLSLSGFSLTGSDIGGFNQDPDGQLFTRWMQLAIFHPVMRTHSMGNNADGATQTDKEAVAKAMEKDRRDQEPWSFGDPFTEHCREAINWRYRLLPTLYTAMEKLHTDGTPILVPSYMDDPSDKDLVNTDAFRFGEHIFVDPCLRENQKSQTTYFPKGTWYHLQSGKVYDGGKKSRLTTPLDYLPVFARGGSVMQVDPVRQHTAAKYPEAPELRIYHIKGKMESSHYLDKGEGYDFEKNGFLRSEFTYNGKAKSATVSVKTKGKFKPPFKGYKLRWFVGEIKPTSLKVDGKNVKFDLVDGVVEAKIGLGVRKMEVA